MIIFNKMSLSFYFIMIIGLSGCGGGGGDSTPVDTGSGTNASAPTTTTQTAYFIDSAVEGVSYTTTKGESGITDSEGKFTYTQGATVTFNIGGVEIGTISNINSDKKVFIQDIVGVERTATDHTEVLKIAQFLQSIDSDNDPSNGIKIEATTRTTLINENKILKSIDISQVETIVTETLKKTFKTSQTAQLHLNSVVQSIGLTPASPIANLPTCEENQKLVGSTCVEKTCEADGYNCPEEVIKTGNVEDKYYGKWVYLHNGDEKNILSTTILNDFEAVDDNLIKITEDGSIYSLMRASIANIQLIGSIDDTVNTRATKRGVSDIGDIDVILTNILDDKIKTEVKTDSDGNFSANTLPSGTYKLTAKDTTKEVSKVVEIKKKNEDLGSFKLTGEGIHNFKAELILDQEFVYADTTTNYTGKIRIHNISNTIGLGLNYTVTSSDTTLDGFSADIASANGSVLPKSYKDIPLSFKLKPIYDNQHSVSVNVKIQDVNNNKWEDNFSFEIYKSSIDIKITSKLSTVNGYIVMPNTNSIKTITNGTITLPLLKDDKYHLILSNPSLENETAYSIGVDTNTQDVASFSATASHEPNDKEAQSNDIALGESIISYLHFGDLDYWTVSTIEDHILAYPLENNFEPKVGARFGEVVTSNELSISIIETGFTIKAAVDYGTIVKNGVDTNSKETLVTYGDKIAIRYTMPENINDIQNPTLSIGEMEKTWIVSNVEIFHNNVLYGTVTSPYTTRVWLDRNLGASRACQSSTDELCYGDYYQFGRDTDGHEKKDSLATSTLATSIDNVGDKFVFGGSIYGDWTSVDQGYSHDLRRAKWSKTDGSSVCPVGFRVPTIEEINAETVAVGITTREGLFTSFLKIPKAGHKPSKYNDDVVYNSTSAFFGSGVYMWSATSMGMDETADILMGYYNVGEGVMVTNGGLGGHPGDGNSVRCIKEGTSVETHTVKTIDSLMWQDDEASRTTVKNPWDEAVNYCNNLALNNFEDWRLPTQDELKTLYQNKNSLTNNGSGWYWSSTQISDDEIEMLYWNDGSESTSSKNNSNFVRCVR